MRWSIEISPRGLDGSSVIIHRYTFDGILTQARQLADIELGVAEVTHEANIVAIYDERARKLFEWGLSRRLWSRWSSWLTAR